MLARRLYDRGWYKWSESLPINALMEPFLYTTAFLNVAQLFLFFFVCGVDGVLVDGVLVDGVLVGGAGVGGSGGAGVGGSGGDRMGVGL